MPSFKRILGIQTQVHVASSLLTESSLSPTPSVYFFLKFFYSFFENFLLYILIIFRPLSSSPLPVPNFMSSVVFIKVCVVQELLGVGPFPGAWSTYRMPHTYRELTPLLPAAVSY